jgi:hypothetical protein
VTCTESKADDATAARRIIGQDVGPCALLSLFSQRSQKLLKPFVEQSYSSHILLGYLWRGGVIIRVGQVISR